MTNIALNPAGTVRHGHLAYLDALRGLAAVGVLATHILQYGYPHLRLNYTPFRLFTNGRCFVVFFFVLSGFVLFLQITGETRKTGYAVYFKRRLARIYIPYLASLLLIVPLAVPSPAQGMSAIASYVLMLGDSAGVSLNPPSWSLVHEIRISLVLPPIYLAMARSPARFWMVAAVVFAASELTIVTMNLGQFPYASDHLAVLVTSSIRFCFMFVCGGQLAAAFRAGRLPLMSHSTGLWLCISVLVLVMMSVLLDQTSLTGSLAVLVVALTSEKLQAQLSRPTLVYLGRISYSLYLTHVIVIAFIAHAVGTGMWVVLAGVLAMPVAALFHRLVEAPSIKLSRSFRKGGNLAPSLAG